MKATRIGVQSQLDWCMVVVVVVVVLLLWWMHMMVHGGGGGDDGWMCSVGMSDGPVCM